MDKGIIIGVDEETSLRRSLDFALFRIITTVSHPPLPSAADCYARRICSSHISFAITSPSLSRSSTTRSLLPPTIRRWCTLRTPSRSYSMLS